MCIDEDYVPPPDPTVLTIMRGQEIACSSISIRDDLLVEETEEFNVSLSILNFTFSAGVNITRETASILIDDNDGKVVLYCSFPLLQ